MLVGRKPTPLEPAETLDWPGERSEIVAVEGYGRLRRVRHHLLSNITEPLSARDAAAIAGLSPNYFSTYFRERVGLSYTRWSHRVRVMVARQLLRDSELTIASIALRTGFRDLRTFERAFKRTLGATPRTFRAQVRARRRRTRPGLTAGSSPDRP